MLQRCSILHSALHKGYTLFAAPIPRALLQTMFFVREKLFADDPQGLVYLHRIAAIELGQTTCAVKQTACAVE